MFQNEQGKNPAWLFLFAGDTALFLIGIIEAPYGCPIFLNQEQILETSLCIFLWHKCIKYSNHKGPEAMTFQWFVDQNLILDSAGKFVSKSGELARNSG